MTKEELIAKKTEVFLELGYHARAGNKVWAEKLSKHLGKLVLEMQDKGQDAKT